MEIEIKQAMAARAGKKIMLIDSSKFGVKSLQQVFSRSELDQILHSNPSARR
jgi:DeoR/GlpR family transcriptional regulator of sugar metabolism